MESFAEDISAIRNASGIDEAKEEITRSFSALGFDRICISVNKATRTELFLTPDINNFGFNDHADYKSAKLDAINGGANNQIYVEKPFWFETNDSTSHQEFISLFNLFGSEGITNGAAIPLQSGHGLIGGAMLGASAPLQKKSTTLAFAYALSNVAMMKLELLGAGPVLTSARTKKLHELTPQQIELLRWAAQGKSNNDIATIMSLTRRGVDYHLSQIFKKLGVTSKSQAVALFSAAGIA